MKKPLIFLGKIFKVLADCLSGRDYNIKRVWRLIMISILFLIAILIFAFWCVSRGPSEKELFLLVEEKKGVVFNRGLMDQVLDFYNQREVEFKSIGEKIYRPIDPSQ